VQFEKTLALDLEAASGRFAGADFVWRPVVKTEDVLKECGSMVIKTESGRVVISEAGDVVVITATREVYVPTRGKIRIIRKVEANSKASTHADEASSREATPGRKRGSR
jgi:hypothetical protein